MPAICDNKCTSYAHAFHVLRMEHLVSRTRLVRVRSREGDLAIDYASSE
jgi:hypothetical protein